MKFGFRRCFLLEIIQLFAAWRDPAAGPAGLVEQGRGLTRAEPPGVVAFSPDNGTLALCFDRHRDVVLVDVTAAHARPRAAVTELQLAEGQRWCQEAREAREVRESSLQSGPRTIAAARDARVPLRLVRTAEGELQVEETLATRRRTYTLLRALKDAFVSVAALSSGGAPLRVSPARRGRLVAMVLRHDHDWQLRLWDLDAGVRADPHGGDAPMLTTFAMSRRNQECITATDSRLCRWSLTAADSKSPGCWATHQARIDWIQVSADGAWILSRDENDEVRLWQSTGKLQCRLAGVTAATFAPDGRGFFASRRPPGESWGRFGATGTDECPLVEPLARSPGPDFKAVKMAAFGEHIFAIYRSRSAPTPEPYRLWWNLGEPHLTGEPRDIAVGRNGLVTETRQGDGSLRLEQRGFSRERRVQLDPPTELLLPHDADESSARELSADGRWLLRTQGQQLMLFHLERERSSVLSGFVMTVPPASFADRRERFGAFIDDQGEEILIEDREWDRGWYHAGWSRFQRPRLDPRALRQRLCEAAVELPGSTVRDLGLCPASAPQ